jgi:hypothetical protein
VLKARGNGVLTCVEALLSSASSSCVTPEVMGVLVMDASVVDIDVLSCGILVCE